MRCCYALAAIVVLIATVAAVPPTYADFHPAANATCYALINASNSSAASNLTVIGWDEAVLLNLTSYVVATARFSATLHTIGWDYLSVQAPPVPFCEVNANSTTASQYGTLGTAVTGNTSYHWFAGVLEGYLTCSRVLDMHEAAVTRDASLPHPRFDVRRAVNVSDATVQWVKDQIAYGQQKIADSNKSNDVSTQQYWASVQQSFDQLQGIADGCNFLFGGASVFSFLDLYLINLEPELQDIEVAVSGASSRRQRPHFRRLLSQHCSALIKVLPEDVYVAHDTWTSYDTMFRIFKDYYLASAPRAASAGEGQQPAHRRLVRFSSYPGFIASADDWYQIGQDTNGVMMVVQETTNGYYDHGLDHFIDNRSVAEFMRVTVANMLAQSGEDWSQLFAPENSGTYNNQYMIVDFSKFTPASRAAPNQEPILADGFLWVLEQLPGVVFVDDETHVVRNATYWASYNIPYFPANYNISGFRDMYDQYGDFFSYDDYARARMFRQRHAEVVDMHSMQSLMRYNDFTSDPLSAVTNCTGCPVDTCSPTTSPMLAIASRGDLAYAPNATVCYGPLVSYLDEAQYGRLTARLRRGRTGRRWLRRRSAGRRTCSSRRTSRRCIRCCRRNGTSPGSPSTREHGN
jgi:hypothetical protein